MALVSELSEADGSKSSNFYDNADLQQIYSTNIMNSASNLPNQELDHLTPKQIIPGKYNQRLASEYDRQFAKDPQQPHSLEPIPQQSVSVRNSTDAPKPLSTQEIPGQDQVVMTKVRQQEPTKEDVQLYQGVGLRNIPVKKVTAKSLHH